MFSMAELDLSRPSSLLLLAVIAGNLMVPVAHFWPQDAEAAPAEARSVGSRPAEPAPPAAESAVQIRTVQVPPLAKRVTSRQPAPVCRAWGPFTELQEAESLAVRLNLASRDFEVFQSEVAATPDYLVTLQVPGARDAAQRIMRELRSHEVESYILDQEGAGSVLAVGVFSVAKRAEARRQWLSGLGYEAVVQPLDRSHRVYHLLARVPADPEPEVPPLGACGDIAPMQQFL